MCYRENKKQEQVIYKDKQCAVLEDAGDSLFIYLKDFVCGWVGREELTFIL